ncbi:hypothetical protein GB937_002723 [Aspergillus fischeri]|nr:hypothetical protein GB937_002723 [Aspergillus fischeri]
MLLKLKEVNNQGFKGLFVVMVPKHLRESCMLLCIFFIYLMFRFISEQESGAANSLVRYTMDYLAAKIGLLLGNSTF